MRNNAIDVAKGIAILMVVFIHTVFNFGFGDVCLLYKYVDSYITCSFMQLFFICSGIFVKQETWRNFFHKKGYGIAIPFVVFYLLGLAIVPVTIMIPGFHANFPFNWQEIFNIYYSRGFRNGALWFLVALFNAFVFMQLVLRVKKIWLQILCALLIFSVGRMEQVTHYRLPFYIGTSCIAFFYVYIGYLLKQMNVLEHLKRNKWMLLLFSITALFTILFWHNVLFMKYNYVTGPFVLTIFTGLCGGISLLALSALISKNRFLEYCGRITMPILCIHSLFTQVVCRVTMRYMNPTSWVTPLVSFIIVVALSLLASEFLLRYCPVIVGKHK